MYAAYMLGQFGHKLHIPAVSSTLASETPSKSTLHFASADFTSHSV